MHTSPQAGVSMQCNDRSKAWNLTVQRVAPWGFGGQNHTHDYSMTGWDPVNYSKGLFADFVAGFQSRVEMIMNVTANESSQGQQITPLVINLNRKHICECSTKECKQCSFFVCVR